MWAMHSANEYLTTDLQTRSLLLCVEILAICSTHQGQLHVQQFTNRFEGLTVIVHLCKSWAKVYHVWEQFSLSYSMPDFNNAFLLIEISLPPISAHTCSNPISAFRSCQAKACCKDAAQNLSEVVTGSLLSGSQGQK